MKLFLPIILTGMLFFGSDLFAQQKDSYLKEYLLSYPNTIGQAVVSPSKWDKVDWLTAGGVILATGGLYLADEELRDLSQRNRTPWSDDVMTGFKQFGEGKYIIPAVGATILGGYLTDSDKTIDTGLLCLKSLILADCLTQGLKVASQRQRPFKNKGNEFWNEAGFSFYRDSFPSGHTTLVWSLAPILAHQYSDTHWVAPVVYSIAALTSYSRINDDKHWSSDVFAGAVIGYFTAELVLKTTPHFTISPDPALRGVSFNLNF